MIRSKPWRRGRAHGIALVATLLLATMPTIAAADGTSVQPKKATVPSLTPAEVADRRHVPTPAQPVGVAALATAATPAKVVTSGSRRSGMVAFTFDDGWNRSACARIADTLRSHRVKGTFFINGDYLKGAPGAWRRILRGMPVGNHTRSHVDLVRSSNEVIKWQLRTNEWLHERILGRPLLKVFRPPYAAHDARVRSTAAKLGYRRMVLWNVDTRDWSASATVGSVTARGMGAPAGSIILFHCARDVTPAALPAIIRHYRARGLEMVGLKRLLRL